MGSERLTNQLGRYRLISELGRGGMSVVYRAVDTRLDRPVALKTIGADLASDPAFQQRFESEARAASAIDHENVVPLYDFGEEDGQLYIVMRLVEGVDLAAEIAAGHLPLRRVFTLLSQVASALDELHGKDLVHLDVKPANILLSRSGSGHEHVYLADFGLSLSVLKGLQNPNDGFLGSPSYASPEHLRSQKVLAASDLYSLTCVLFACLAGRPPFVGRVHEVISGHLRGAIPSLAALGSLPVAIDRVIARGMAAKPEQRYATCSELIGAARRALTNLDPDTIPAQAAWDAQAESSGGHVGGEAVVRVDAAPPLRLGRHALKEPGDTGHTAPGQVVIGRPVSEPRGETVPMPLERADSGAGLGAQAGAADDVDTGRIPVVSGSVASVSADAGGFSGAGGFAGSPVSGAADGFSGAPASSPAFSETAAGPASVLSIGIPAAAPVPPSSFPGTASFGSAGAGLAAPNPPPKPASSQTVRVVIGLVVLVVAVVAGLLIWQPWKPADTTPSNPGPSPISVSTDEPTLPILTPNSLPIPRTTG